MYPIPLCGKRLVVVVAIVFWLPTSVTFIKFLLYPIACFYLYMLATIFVVLLFFHLGDADWIAEPQFWT